MPLQFIPAFPKLPKITAFFTTRAGGCSSPPYRSLNLGQLTNDDLSSVRKNWATVSQQANLHHSTLNILHQTHSDTLIQASEHVETFKIKGDALYTSKPGYSLAVMAADCLPILIYDPKRSTIAAVHAGWRGTKKQILRTTLQTLSEKDILTLSTVQICLGPCILPCHFRVGEEVRAQFPREHQIRRDGNAVLDLQAINYSQAIKLGIPKENISRIRKCTWCDQDSFFSYRRDNGNTGRMAGVIALK